MVARMAGGGESGAAILAAFLANVGIAIAKFVGFVITGSSALLAEAVHSVADAGNQGLLALGGKRAERAPTTLQLAARVEGSMGPTSGSRGGSDARW